MRVVRYRMLVVQVHTVAIFAVFVQEAHYADSSPRGSGLGPDGAVPV
jgi:hypothetical protein